MRELSYQVPKAVNNEDMNQLIVDYVQAAKNAIEAGFDGVEIHGANGYLLDQFLHYDSNRRTDQYGQTPENMSRFPLAVIDAIIAAIGNERTALRVSPAGYVNIESNPKDRDVFDYFLNALEQRNLAYLHEGMFDDSVEFDYLGGQVSQYMRENYSQTLVAVGGYNAKSASAGIALNKFDLIAIGRPFIANPDYVAKIRKNEVLFEYNEAMLTELI